MAPKITDSDSPSVNTSNCPGDSYDSVNLGLHLDDHSWIERTYDLFKATVQMSMQLSQQQEEQK